jgi:hypothetical protein
MVSTLALVVALGGHAHGAVLELLPHVEGLARRTIDARPLLAAGTALLRLLAGEVLAQLEVPDDCAVIEHDFVGQFLLGGEARTHAVLDAGAARGDREHHCSEEHGARAPHVAATGARPLGRGAGATGTSLSARPTRNTR